MNILRMNILNGREMVVHEEETVLGSCSVSSFELRSGKKFANKVMTSTSRPVIEDGKKIINKVCVCCNKQKNTYKVRMTKIKITHNKVIKTYGLWLSTNPY